MPPPATASNRAWGPASCPTTRTAPPDGTRGREGRPARASPRSTPGRDSARTPSGVIASSRGGGRVLISVRDTEEEAKRDPRPSKLMIAVSHPPQRAISFQDTSYEYLTCRRQKSRNIAVLSPYPPVSGPTAPANRAVMIIGFPDRRSAGSRRIRGRTDFRSRWGAGRIRNSPPTGWRAYRHACARCPSRRSRAVRQQPISHRIARTVRVIPAHAA